MAHFPDTYSARGADRIKATIVNYWLAQGYTSVRVERYQVWEGVWGIRSNLVNGLPPLALTQSSPSNASRIEQASQSEGVAA